MEALLRFEPSLTHRVYDEFDPGCITRREDGSLEVQAVFPDDPRLWGYLLSFGPGLRVLSPASLRAKLAQLGKEIAQNNQAEV